MKKIFIGLLVLGMISMATANDKHDSRISLALTEAGVLPIGHRDYQEAYLICRIAKDGNAGQPLCDITN